MAELLFQETGERPPNPSRTTWENMRSATRWLIATPDKMPFYANGHVRRGPLDGPADIAQLATYEEAVAVRNGRPGWLLAFALGLDNCGGRWQGVDYDDILNNRLSDLASAVPGYVEVSPSGKGAHAIGYGRNFSTLGSNGTGIEAYSGARYFTVTERVIRDGQLVCLADYVEQVLAPRHRVVALSGPLPDLETEVLDPKQVTALRSALLHLRADDYPIWIRMGLALRGLGDTGRGLFLSWSATSSKFDPKEASAKWDGFKPTETDYRSVFAEAQRQGWLNPASNSAQLDDLVPVSEKPRETTPTPRRELVGRSLGDVQARSIDWLWTGWIPKGYITIFAGETGAGKSTVLADIAARVTTGRPWPGEFASGPPRAPARVLWLGSEDGIEEMTVPRLMASHANLHNVIELQGVTHQGKRNTFSMQDDLEAVADWLAAARNEGLPFAMLVIDPVTSYLPGQKLRRVDLNDAGHLRTILEPWLVLAQLHNIAIVCVTHFAKDTTRSMIHRVLGSAAFAQTCRSLCAVVEPPSTDDYEPGPFERAMIQVKTNLPEQPSGAWKFSTAKVEVGIDQRNGRPITATRPSWEELDRALTAKTAVGSSRGPKSQQAPQFAVLVRGLFAGYAPGTWLPVEQVKASAVGSGTISDKWWQEESGRYLEKNNSRGTWMCRLLPVPQARSG
ncbi:MAG: AAA family ATPase [Devosia sp.]